MSAQQFLENLFGTLPAFFKSEDELRAIWSAPETRKGLLEGLAERGFGKDALSEMQQVIDARNSDLFDVLAYVAFALPLETRQERAQSATSLVHANFSEKQEAFIAFVLAQYVAVGVEELDRGKISPLLRRIVTTPINASADLLGELFMT